MIAPPPVVLPVKSESIPQLLKNIPQWVGWKVGKLKENGKYDKLPTNRHGSVCNAHEGANQMTFDDAYDGYQNKRFSGIGLDLNGRAIKTDAKGELYLVGIDIDHCVSSVDGSPVLSEEANNTWIRLGQPYLELSPSGKGVRLFVLSRTLLAGGNRNQHEMYCNGRFLTITGHGTGQILETTAEVMTLHAEWFPEKTVVKPNAELSTLLQRTRSHPPSETQNEVERLKSALSYLSADTDYEQWRNTLWAIAATNWSCAEKIAMNWSKSAPERYSDEGFYNIWNGYDQTRGITVATLFHYAKAAGWAPVLSKASAMGTDDEGDILNGRLFAEAYRGKLIFIHETGDLLTFNESGWVHALPGEAEMRAKAIVKQLRENAAEAFKVDPLGGSTKILMSHATKSSMEPRIRAMISMAQSEAGMTVRLSQFDADPFMFGVANGVLDLGASKLLQPSPELLVSMRAHVSFEIGTKCPNWVNFMNSVQPDKGVQRLLQQLVGVFLTGHANLQKLIIIYGLGCNGKSTFIEVIAWVLGDYGHRIATEMLMQHQRSPQGPSPDIVGLKGKRLAYCNEVEEGRRLDEARVKELTGGDTLTGRTLYAKQNVTFQPSHNLVMVGNHKPEVHDSSFGMWRRMLLIPFEVTIPPDKQDRSLVEKLKAEGSGILNWGMAGLRDFQRCGLRIPKTISLATDAYRDDEDLLGEWLDEQCELGANNSHQISQCYSAYSHWARNRGNGVLAQSRLTRRLKDRGILRDPGKRNYVGIKLNELGMISNRIGW